MRCARWPPPRPDLDAAPARRRPGRSARPLDDESCRRRRRAVVGSRRHRARRSRSATVRPILAVPPAVHGTPTPRLLARRPVDAGHAQSVASSSPCPVAGARPARPRGCRDSTRVSVVGSRPRTRDPVAPSAARVSAMSANHVGERRAGRGAGEQDAEVRVPLDDTPRPRASAELARDAHAPAAADAPRACRAPRHARARRPSPGRWRTPRCRGCARSRAPDRLDVPASRRVDRLAARPSGATPVSVMDTLRSASASPDPPRGRRRGSCLARRRARARRPRRRSRRCRARPSSAHAADDDARARDGRGRAHRDRAADRLPPRRRRRAARYRPRRAASRPCAARRCATSRISTSAPVTSTVPVGAAGGRREVRLARARSPEREPCAERDGLAVGALRERDQRSHGAAATAAAMLPYGAERDPSPPTAPRGRERPRDRRGAPPASRRAGTRARRAARHPGSPTKCASPGSLHVCAPTRATARRRRATVRRRGTVRQPVAHGPSTGGGGRQRGIEARARRARGARPVAVGVRAARRLRRTRRRARSRGRHDEREVPGHAAMVPRRRPAGVSRPAESTARAAAWRGRTACAAPWRAHSEVGKRDRPVGVPGGRRRPSRRVPARACDGRAPLRSSRAARCR